MKPQQAKTVDEHCGKPAGSFNQFIKDKEAFLRNLENDRKERIRASRQTARDLAWAA